MGPEAVLLVGVCCLSKNAMMYCCSMLQCAAVCCSMMQCALQCVACLSRTVKNRCSVLHLCCSLVRCIAVCINGLQVFWATTIYNNHLQHIVEEQGCKHIVDEHGCKHIVKEHGCTTHCSKSLEVVTHRCSVFSCRSVLQCVAMGYISLKDFCNASLSCVAVRCCSVL